MVTRKVGSADVPAAPKPKGAPRNKKNMIPLQTGAVAVYASPRISRAMEEITEDMTLYHGVRLSQILEAVYMQGRKDGARNVFEEIDKKVSEARREVPHKNPGKPKKSR